MEILTQDQKLVFFESLSKRTFVGSKAFSGRNVWIVDIPLLPVIQPVSSSAREVFSWNAAVIPRI